MITAREGVGEGGGGRGGGGGEGEKVVRGEGDGEGARQRMKKGLDASKVWLPNLYLYLLFDSYFMF